MHKRYRAVSGASFWLAYSDILTNVLIFILFMLQAMIWLPHLKSNTEAKAAGIAPGSMCVNLYWPDDLDLDIDLWGRGPDGKIIGYSNKDGALMNLLRDDLGTYNDPSGRNFETICSRSLMAGEWVFNAHYYANRARPDLEEVPVILVVSFPSNPDKVTISQDAIKVTGKLVHVNDELTLIDFRLDKDGRVVHESINHIQQPLRSAK